MNQDNNKDEQVPRILGEDYEFTINNNTGFIEEIPIQISDTVLMPRTLTAENGAKGLMSGEFFETMEIPNEEYCGCEECDFCKDFPDTEETIILKVPVSWTNIKSIYKKLIDSYSKNTIK